MIWEGDINALKIKYFLIWFIMNIVVRYLTWWLSLCSLWHRKSANGDKVHEIPPPFSCKPIKKKCFNHFYTILNYLWLFLLASHCHCSYRFELGCSQTWEEKIPSRRDHLQSQTKVFLTWKKFLHSHWKFLFEKQIQLMIDFYKIT